MLLLLLLQLVLGVLLLQIYVELKADHDDHSWHDEQSQRLPDMASEFI